MAQDAIRNNLILNAIYLEFTACGTIAQETQPQLHTSGLRVGLCLQGVEIVVSSPQMACMFSTKVATWTKWI